ncbi:MAG TPA: hypothetical protein VM056_00410, partial [Terriglobales bacterium]|nr:hypothetical protein [Terriglobales bacterium]
LRKANLSIVFLAFVMASPLGSTWCDAVCTKGSGQGTHHGSANSTPVDHQSSASVHQHHQTLPTASIITSLTGHDSSCVAPRLDVWAAGKTNFVELHLQLVSATSATDFQPKAYNIAYVPAQGSLSDLSPPGHISLRI